jgi:hypothetical protein
MAASVQQRLATSFKENQRIMLFQVDMSFCISQLAQRYLDRMV